MTLPEEKILPTTTSRIRVVPQGWQLPGMKPLWNPPSPSIYDVVKVVPDLFDPFNNLSSDPNIPSSRELKPKEQKLWGSGGARPVFQGRGGSTYQVQGWPVGKPPLPVGGVLWRDIQPKNREERKEMYNRCGAKCFGSPTTLGYPICSPSSCKPNPLGIDAARSRANQFRDHPGKIGSRARSVLKKTG